MPETAAVYWSERDKPCEWLTDRIRKAKERYEAMRTDVLGCIANEVDKDSRFPNGTRLKLQARLRTLGDIIQTFNWLLSHKRPWNK
jgi:hypothetical protein